MKRFKPTLFLFFTFTILNSVFQNCNAQAGEWTWMKGDSTYFSFGSYGTQGVPSPSNEPRARWACGHWTDTAGNFWIYSGLSEIEAGISLDDLWKFDPQNLMWTFMKGDFTSTAEKIVAGKGIYDPQNSPGALLGDMFTWVTSNNHLWLFGGLPSITSYTDNDNLWQFDPAINQWAWMGKFGTGPNLLANYGTKGIGDSTTMPGGRCAGNCAWTDSSGNLWLFGGEGYDDYCYNDMWEYNVITGIWTWMSGSSNPNDSGSYGIVRQPSANNFPSARATYLFWKDDEGDFWMAGGHLPGFYLFQDVWNFNPQTLQWTWVNGPEGNDSSISGVNCQLDTANKPGARWENSADWKICDDLVITYSGSNSTLGFTGRNDLWAYKRIQNEWFKINSWPERGSYGIKGVSNSSNYPSSRYGSAGFEDRDNNLWLFGGITDLVNGIGYFNDLWKYVLDTLCVGDLTCTRGCTAASPAISTAEKIICANDSTQICAPASYTSYQWSASATGTGACVYVKLAGDYYVTVTDVNGCTAQSNHLSISVYPDFPVSIVEKGDTLSSFGAVSYQWYFNNNAINNANGPVYIANQSGSYTVQITDTNGCTAISEPVSITGVNDLTEEARVMLYPNPCSVANVQLSVGSELIGSELEIYDDEGRMVFKSEIRNSQSEIAVGGLPGGVYFLQISSANVSITKKLVKL